MVRAETKFSSPSIIDREKKERDALALKIRVDLIEFVRNYGKSYAKQLPPEGRLAQFKYSRELKKWQIGIASYFNPRDRIYALSDEEQKKVRVINQIIHQESGDSARVMVAAFGEVDKARIVFRARDVEHYRGFFVSNPDNSVELWKSSYFKSIGAGYHTTGDYKARDANWIDLGLFMGSLQNAKRDLSRKERRN